MALSTRPATEVELFISCRNLVDKDVFSKSDPIVVVQESLDGTKWAEFARTEHVKNNLNPVFKTSIQITYRFEEVQRLKFVVHDVDNPTSTLNDDDYLGDHTCTLAQIVSSGTYMQPLSAREKAQRQAGILIVRAEEVRVSRNLLRFTMNGIGLDKKDTFGKSDPYLDFATEDDLPGFFTVVHHSEVIKNTLNPVWPPFELKANLFGNERKRIKVTCYDWDMDGSMHNGTNDLIGEFYTNLPELLSGKKLRWELINQKKTKKKNYKNSGVIECSVETLEEYSFFDYMVGGCQINFTVGIDFTASNKDPKFKYSLHYLDPDSPSPTNQYTEALTAVGSVVQDYDTDKLFPAFGFGAELPGQNEVSHEFPLNANPQNPYCFGIHGVLEAYRYSLANVKLSGPTHAAPIINHVAEFARQADLKPESQVYFILLMLTDGALTDMDATKTAIIKASHLPMSVIIIGVGKADFTSMRALDSDDRLLRHGGDKAARDIVQFVPYEAFKESSREALARSVLAEVPQQVVDYFKMKRVKPKERVIPPYF